MFNKQSPKVWRAQLWERSRTSVACQGEILPLTFAEWLLWLDLEQSPVKSQ